MTRVTRSYLLALAVWPLFLASAMSLGAVREGVIVPAFGEPVAHVIGTLLFIVVMLTIMWVLVSRIRESVGQFDLWLIGFLWTIMTVCFEFGFFHYVAGVPWEKLLADYNLFAGRLWILVLMTTLCGPGLIGHWLRKPTD